MGNRTQELKIHLLRVVDPLTWLQVSTPEVVPWTSQSMTR